MRSIFFRVLWVLIPIGLLAMRNASARDLSFEERVAAQEAIERVYYSHQKGATKPFEEAVPRAVLEDKVRKYLQQTVALEVYWKTGITGEMLQRELERMERGTRLPGRLRELYAALNGDPFLIKECLARATLVDRLARNFYALDSGLHVAARERAEELRRQIEEGELDPNRPHPDRTVVEWLQREPETVPPNQPPRMDPNGERSIQHLLSPDAFRRARARLPEASERVAGMTEERDAFVVRVVLRDAPREVRVASYTVPKKGWDSWWEEAKSRLPDQRVDAVASGGEALLLDRVRRASEPAGSGPSANLDAGFPHDQFLHDAADDAWSSGALDHPVDPRSTHTAVWTGSVMVIWGGQLDGTTFDTGGLYDPATDSWRATSTTGAPSARTFHTAVWTGSVMVVWGGSGLSGHVNTGGRYDPVADTWTATSTVGAPSRRFGHTALWTGSEMVVWSGYNGGLDEPDDRPNTGGRYDPVADTWTPTSTVGAPLGRESHTAVWTGNVMIVWGGYFFDGSLSHYLDTGGRYDPATDTWTATSLAGAPSGRQYHTAVWTGSVMIVWGGSDTNLQEFFNTGGRYDPVTDIWTAMSTLAAPSGRDEHNAIWTGNAMVVWGGDASGGQSTVVFDTGGRYDPATDTWTATSTMGAPSARSGQSAVWTGSVMVVWGGIFYDDHDAVGYFNTGGRYDPATNTWTATSSPPSAREYHTAIWTGNVMVIWGGAGNDSLLDSGNRYDPVTDNWTATSTAGAASARQHHTAVWTGSVMVVWGGFSASGNGYLDTGWRYDPITDLWTATSTVGAPSARRYHTAVWTGSVMVVWGGRGTGQLPNTGGCYDPATNTWTATTTVGAPSAREHHTAVWTGSKMVVWGGSSGLGYLNTGGRYDPATNIWTATSTVGAPSQRQYHTAVWTGSRMAVWGGTNAGGPMDTGGRYDPAADVWTAMSTAGAPTARQYHTAVWTGSGMVVWGGDAAEYPIHLNTGGRYDPASDTWMTIPTADAPSGRYAHTALWTDSEMVVWGGDNDLLGYLNTGGRYVPCESVTLWHPDQDQDGFGDGSSGVSSCIAPPGFIAAGGDCDDASPAVYPGAPQVCDGLNNDCLDPGWPSVAGTTEADNDGDSFSGCQGDCNDANPQVWFLPTAVAGLSVAGSDPTSLEWNSQGGGPETLYDLVSGLLAGSVDFASGTCLQSAVGTTYGDTRTIPVPDTGFWYLVRAKNSCGMGTYGSTERDNGIPSCP